MPLDKRWGVPLILSFSRDLALARLPLGVAISASGYAWGEGTLESPPFSGERLRP
jgi:hypothetical protein